MSEFEKSTSLEKNQYGSKDSLRFKKSTPLLTQKQLLEPVISLEPSPSPSSRNSSSSGNHNPLQSQASFINPLHDLESVTDLILRHEIGIVKDLNAGEVYDPYTQRTHPERLLTTEERFVLINKEGFNTLYVAVDRSTECQKIFFRGNRKFSIDVDGSRNVPKFEIERTGVAWTLFRDDEVQKD